MESDPDYPTDYPQQVARQQRGGQVGKAAVYRRRTPAVEQARGAALGRGVLGN